MFRSGELTQIEPKVPLRMLITNTKVGRNTKALVSAVGLRSSRHPKAMASIFTAVDSISKELSEILGDLNDLSVASKEDEIRELMEINQGLLQSMGVSHSSIEDVIRITSNYKLTSKLTGAGGGGCVLTLLPTCILCSIFSFSFTYCHIGYFKSAMFISGLAVCIVTCS